MASGIINVNKPLGITSMDVVRSIRKASHIKKVGHGGTLDPLATGVLPVACGKATRLLEYILNDDKHYHATIELGIRTDTFDREGRIIDERDSSAVTDGDVHRILSQYCGEIVQFPPKYSAIKVKGKRLYELARAGAQVDIKPRPVKVYYIQLIAFEPPLLTVDIKCGKGFYVRSFAEDLGNSLQCGAHLKGLQRTSTGPFDISGSVELHKVLSSFEKGTEWEVMKEPGACLEGLEVINLTLNESTLVSHGRRIPADVGEVTTKPLERSAAYNDCGELIAVMKLDKNAKEWQPVKVFV